MKNNLFPSWCYGTRLTGRTRVGTRRGEPFHLVQIEHLPIEPIIPGDGRLRDCQWIPADTVGLVNFLKEVST